MKFGCTASPECSCTALHFKGSTCCTLTCSQHLSCLSFSLRVTCKERETFHFWHCHCDECTVRCPRTRAVSFMTVTFGLRIFAVFFDRSGFSLLFMYLVHGLSFPDSFWLRSQFTCSTTKDTMQGHGRFADDVDPRVPSVTCVTQRNLGSKQNERELVGPRLSSEPSRRSGQTLRETCCRGNSRSQVLQAVSTESTLRSTPGLYDDLFKNHKVQAHKDDEKQDRRQHSSYGLLPARSLVSGRTVGCRRH